MANPPPATKVKPAATSTHRNAARPWPKGWRSSAGWAPLRTATNSSTSVVVSAKECADSDSMAAEPLSNPVIALATATPRLANPATTIVRELST